MSRGKYSPNCPHANDDYEFKYNSYGQEPSPWTKEMIDAGETYDSKTMFDNYDEEGYDSYGYSAFDSEGNYVGDGNGIDRDGYTELDYLTLRDIPEDHRGSYHYYNY